MNKDDVYDFLLRATVPEILEANRLPLELRWEKGRKKEKEKEEGYSTRKLVWECISRAHRDVLSGRKNVTCYSNEKDGEINKIALSLYGYITNPTPDIPISSEALINKLVLKDKVIGIGVAQKLVNMTLKYMFIMQMFGKLKEYNINENDCDCPLDSRILSSLGFEYNKWTNDFITEDNSNSCDIYNKIQKKIDEKQGNNKSRLSYDFDYWQHF